MLFAASFALYLYYGLHPLWDGESMYAEAPREMLISGDFLHPTLNFAPFLFKPPLYIWSNAASMALFGQGELGVRLPCALFAALTVLFTFGIGSRLSLRAGIFSGAVLATSYGFVFHTSTMLTDIPLTMFTAASIYFFLKALDNARWGVPGLYASLALAVMTKGFVGLVFPGLAFVSFILLEKRWDVLRRLVSLPGLAIFLAIAVPWHIAMEAANPGFLKGYIINEQVLRFFNKRFPPDADSVNTPLFILVTLGWLMPWAAYLLQSVLSRIKKKDNTGNVTERLALYWAFGGMVFLCLSGSKMEYYSLPVLPAFALLIGGYWSMLCGPERPGARWAIAGTLFIAGAALAGIFAFPHLSATIKDWLSLSASETAGISKVAELTFLLLLAGALSAACLLAIRRPSAAFAAMFLTAGLVSISARPAIGLVSNSFSSAETARAVTSILSPGDLVVVDGDTEYEFCATFNYYSGRKVLILKNNGNPVLSVKFDEKDRFLINDEEFEALWSSGRRAYLVTSRNPVMDGIHGMPEGDFKMVYGGHKAVYANLFNYDDKANSLTALTAARGGKYAGKGTVFCFPDVQRRKEYRGYGCARPRNGQEGCTRL